jgi:hypothetical protein
MSQSKSINEDQVKHKGGKGVVQVSEPYVVEVEIVGVDPMLFHRYDIQDVESKASAKKGSKERKTDNLAGMVYRDSRGYLVFPGINFKACLREAARFKQDPRSSRKSLRDMIRAAIKVPEDASFETKEWDYEDRRPVVIKQNRVPRTRPAMKAGWKLVYRIHVLLAEYVDEDLLHELCVDAGRLIGLGDFRPDFGCFRVTRFKVISMKSKAA